MKQSTFLNILVIFLLLSICADSSSAKRSKRKDGSKYSVAIVGAGVAGITAASYLWENGIKDFVILEATNRTGGRINSILTTGYPSKKEVIEMGAEWIHGEEDNMMYEYCAKNGLLIEETTKETSKEGGEDEEEVDIVGIFGRFRTEDGKGLDEKITHKFIEIILTIEASILGDNVTVIQNWEDVTVLRYYKEQINKQFKEKGLDNLDSTLKEGLLHWYLQARRSFDGCDNHNQMSLASANEYEFCEGKQEISLKYGYKAVLEHLGADIPAEAFLLNWPVKNIAINRDQKAVVTSTSGKVITANHVIVTSSLGYLKAHLNTMFTPNLPRFKLDAIRAIGFGTVNKIFIEFEKPFWNSTDGYSFVRRSTREDNWTDGVFGFYPVFNRTNILCGWVTGVSARDMESRSNKEILEGSLDLLRKFTGIHNLPRVLEIYPSRWNSNPYTLGSYSFQTLKSYKLNKAVHKLKEPLYRRKTPKSKKLPIVVFAGEATHPNYFSTVHGAMESGYREAERLISCCVNDLLNVTVTASGSQRLTASYLIFVLVAANIFKHFFYHNIMYS